MKPFLHHTLHRSTGSASPSSLTAAGKSFSYGTFLLCLSVTAQAQPAIVTSPASIATSPVAVLAKPTAAPVKPAAAVKAVAIPVKAIVIPAKPPSAAVKTTVPTGKPVAAPAKPVVVAPPVVAPSASLKAASATVSPIIININGRTTETDPTPVLQRGSVLVPLRGVLENLGAKVSYDPATTRIDILQNGKRFSLKVGENSAAVENSVVPLASAPLNINGRTFVPLRSLAELFGYEVSWLANIRTVAIVSDKPTPPKGGTVPIVAGVEHKAALKAAGRYGIAINFHDASPSEVEPLLDAAKKAGAGLVKFRFDWNALEPTEGSAFQWPLYDRVVKAARERGLVVVGVLGNTTRWATLYPRSENPNEWRNSPPKPAYFPAWDNYVRRVVGRYGKDVQAWQVWENPATYNFRSVAKDYRIVTRRALDAARTADPKAILFTAEPGGVNLGFIEELRRNGLLAHVNGVSLYPVSQWQPGVPAQAEESVLPITTLLKDPLNRDKEYWINGLSRLSLENSDLLAGAKVFNTKDTALQRALVQSFTPNAQADYLVRSTTLALASGIDKVFWGDLRDQAKYDSVDPVNSLYGGGLLKADSTPRPSFDAYSNLTKLVGNKQFVGAASAGPRAIVLVFEGEDGIIGVAWAASGQEKNPPKLTLDPSRDPGLPSSVYLKTLEGSQVLDSLGEEVGGDSGVIALSQRPVWITNLSFAVPLSIRENAIPGAFRLLSQENNQEGVDILRAVFAPGNEGEEQGLYWRKYLGFRGSATDFADAEGMMGLKTTYSRDIYNPAAGQPNIYLDVANNFLFFARGRAVTLKIEVKRPAKTQGPFGPKGGFNIQYDSPTGFKLTPWNVVEGGEGWQTFTIEIPDASFANRDGFDLMINTWGAKQDLIFRSVVLQKDEARVAGETSAAAALN